MDSLETIEELELLVRSKRTVIYLVSQEENRVLSALENLCSKADTSWDLLKWDIVSGLHSTFPEFLPAKASECVLDQEEVLSWFKKLIVPKNKFCILVLKDYNKFFGWIPDSAAKIVMKAPDGTVIIGIDEDTALVTGLDEDTSLTENIWRVYGEGSVHILSGAPTARFKVGELVNLQVS
jgi:hypothetical protein